MVWTLAHPAEQPIERVHGARVGLQRQTKLLLTTGPAQVEHHPACDLQGELPSEVLLDERQGQIQARGDSGGRPDVTGAHEDRIRLHRGLRMEPLQLCAKRPVRGADAAGEQPSARQQKAARAHTDNPPRALREPTQRRDERRIVIAGARPLTAGDKQHVQVAAKPREPVTRS